LNDVSSGEPELAAEPESGVAIHKQLSVKSPAAITLTIGDRSSNIRLNIEG
jgi:hypothetical protein